MLHCGLDWLERRAHDEQVLVNLFPDTEDATESVQFKHAQVRQCLGNVSMHLETQPGGVRKICLDKRTL